VPGRHPLSKQRDVWLQTAVGIAELSAGVWLLVLWLVGAPWPVLAALILLSFGLGAFSWWRWRRRPEREFMR